MSAKNCLVVVYPNNQEPYVVRPSAKGETHFSKKEAQRQAAAHVGQHGNGSAEIVEVAMVVNAGYRLTNLRNLVSS